MADKLEDLRSELLKIRPFMGKIDWKDQIYSDEKAYVTAVFSSIAYLKIPDFELQHHDLAKIIPCLAYHQQLDKKSSVDIERFIASAEFGNNIFVITTANVVVVGIVTDDVIIVALRGTRLLYLSDWISDIHATKTLTYVGNYEVKFHSGFYLAITECIEQIASEVNRRNNNSIPVYVVGHSLGGALAGITCAVDGATFRSDYRYGTDISVKMNVNSCYTFGMPRYGDDIATMNLHSPFHIYNHADIVPNLPPKSLGFHDVPNKYCIGKASKGYARYVLNILSARGIRHHFIDDYIKLLKINVGD